MRKYRIKVSVTVEPVDSEDGDEGTSACVEEIVDKGVAWSIDDCEDAVVKLGFEAMRQEMSKHMASVSKRGLSKLETVRS